MVQRYIDSEHPSCYREEFRGKQVQGGRIQEGKGGVEKRKKRKKLQEER